MSVKILIVEDDEQIRSFIGYALSNQKYETVTADCGTEALRRFEEDRPDIMILDLGLPDMDGKEVIRKVREKSLTPILVVSARDQENEKVAALDQGADDYLTKPFSTTELLARVRVAARHLDQHLTEHSEPTLVVRDLRIDPDKRLTYLGGQEIHLTPMEYQLLHYMMQNVGKVMTSGAIISELWGAGYGNDTQALRTLMAGLRRKIEKNPGKPEYIVTEIGVGYRLKEG